MSDISGEYDLIELFYKDKTAKRSGVRLMNHIDEGIQMMYEMRASGIAISAFCLHPIAQSGNKGFHILLTAARKQKIRHEAIHLAQQYAYAANSFLCKPSTDHFTHKDLCREVGPLNQDLIHMLVADKIQNEKDFELYHKGSHPRSEQLAHYFNLWLEYLEYCEAVLHKRRLA
uniref:Uncharacterized protein n=1 Tax=Pseudomonas phage Nican01 TaxID=3138540 RepID=A0AAU6W1B1_9CAUD